MLDFPTMAPMAELTYGVAMPGDGNIWIRLRRLGAGLLLLAALMLPLNAAAPALPGIQDCDCSQEQDHPCPAQLSCGMSCAGLVQLPVAQRFQPPAPAPANVIATSPALFPRSLRPDLPPPRL